MAHIEILWKCPGCHRSWETQREANRCAISHVRAERWAISDKYPGKAVSCNYRGEKWALREADLSDDINERKRDLAELEKNSEAQSAEPVHGLCKKRTFEDKREEETL